MRGKIILAVILFCFVPPRSLAENERFNNSAEVRGGIYLNEGAWSVEPRYSWYFHKYFGISVGAELTRQYNEPTRTTVINGHEAELTDNERDIAWIILKPSFLLRTPPLWKNRDEDTKLWIQAEPGVSIGCPFHNSLTYEIKEIHGNVGHTVDYRRFPNKGLNCFYWNIGASLNLELDRFVFGLGYGISNLDYYSGRRNVTLDDGSRFRVPEKTVSQNIFLKIGYSF